MSEKLGEFKETYSRSDQARKREIGEYLHDRPSRWISKKKLKDITDLDESVVNRHINTLHEDGFLKTMHGADGQLQAQWNGKGAGGFVYWIRQLIPNPLRSAYDEVRPLLTIEFLGGAFFPSLMFALLMIIGLATAFFAVVITYYPGDSILGITVAGAVFLAGVATVFASLFLLCAPLALLLDRGLRLIWKKIYRWVASEGGRQ